MNVKAPAETDIDSAIAEAARLLPGLAVELSRFRNDVARRGGAEGLNLPDLLLAWASLEGDAAALAELDRRLCAVGLSVVKRIGCEASAEDVLQEVREKLLVGPRARLRAYEGRGALVRYLKAVVLTASLDRRRRDDAAPRERDDAALADLAAGDSGPESWVLRRNGAEAFNRAFGKALAQLTAEDRAMLRLRFVDGLAIEDVGRALQIHRTTAMRRLEKLQQTLHSETRRALRQELGASESELDSMIRGLDLSLSDRLSRLLPAQR